MDKTNSTSKHYFRYDQGSWSHNFISGTHMHKPADIHTCTHTHSLPPSPSRCLKTSLSAMAAGPAPEKGRALGRNGEGARETRLQAEPRLHRPRGRIHMCLHAPNFLIQQRSGSFIWLSDLQTFPNVSKNNSKTLRRETEAEEELACVDSPAVETPEGQAAACTVLTLALGNVRL